MIRTNSVCSTSGAKRDLVQFYIGTAASNYDVLAPRFSLLRCVHFLESLFQFSMRLMLFLLFRWCCRRRFCSVVLRPCSVSFVFYVFGYPSSPRSVEGPDSLGPVVEVASKSFLRFFASINYCKSPFLGSYACRWTRVLANRL